MENLTLLSSSAQDLAAERKILSTSDDRSDCKAEENLQCSIEDFDNFEGDNDTFPGEAFMGPKTTNSFDDQSPTNAVSLYKKGSDSSTTSQPSAPPPPPPPPPPLLNIPPPPPFLKQPFGKGTHDSRQDETSSTKLRRLNWEKIPDIQIMNADNNIWAESQSQIKVDFQTIDDLFTVENRSSKRKSFRNLSITTISSELGESDSSEENSKRKISLLDSKRSLNIHIFLRQFKRSIDVLAESIRVCEMSFMNYDRLLSLRKLLPNKDEIKTLREFKGPPSNLDSADYFLLCVISIPHYGIRIDLMLLREEFDHALGQIDQSLSVLKQAMQEIRGCYALPSILHLVLQAGNYLNRGASFGNASGFRLASLKALADTKANKPGITLMHYVAMELKKNDPKMMNWTKEVSSVDSAARISEEEIKEQIKTFQKRIKTVKRKVEEDGDDELRQNAEKFLKKAKASLDATCAEEERLVTATSQLATYLCENPHRFALSNCFQIVAEFRTKFIKATLENEKREEAERKRESKNRMQDQNNNNNNNYKLSSMNKSNKNNTSVDGHATVEDERLSWLKKNNLLRRSFSVATPHRRYNTLYHQSADNVDASDIKTLSNGRSRSYNRDLKNLQEISIIVSSPPEESMHYKEIELSNKNYATANKSPKVAWEGTEELAKSDAPFENKSPEILDVNARLNDGKILSEARKLSIDDHQAKIKERISRNGLSDETESNQRSYTEQKDSPRMTLEVPTTRSRARTSEEEKFKKSENLLPVDSNAKNCSNDDLERSMHRFVQRERDRMFERTQLRRSYICLPKDEDELVSRDSDGSDSDSSKSDKSNKIVGTIPAYMRRKQFQRRFSPLASQSDTVLSTSHHENMDMFSEDASRALEEKSETDDVIDSRHDDIRERIRRYKESTSSSENNSSLDRRKSSSSLTDLSRRRSSSEHSNIPSQRDSSLDSMQPAITSPSSRVQRKAEKDSNKPTKFASTSSSQLSTMDECQEHAESNNTSSSDVANEPEIKESNAKSVTEIKSNEPECVTIESKESQKRSDGETQAQTSKLVRRNSSLLRCRTPASRPKVMRQSIHFPITENISNPSETSSEKQNNSNSEKPNRAFSSNSTKSLSRVPEKSISTHDVSKTPTKKKTAPSVSGVKTLISKLIQSKKKPGKALIDDKKNVNASSKKKMTAKTLQVKEVTSLRSDKSIAATSKAKDVSTSPRKSGLDKKLTGRPSSTTSVNTSKVTAPSPRKPQQIRQSNVSPCRPASRSSGIISPASKSVVTASAVSLNKAARLQQKKLQKQDSAKPTTAKSSYSQSLMKTPRSSTLPRTATSTKFASSPKLETLTKKKFTEPDHSEASASKVKPVITASKPLQKPKTLPSGKSVITRGISATSSSTKIETSKKLEEIKETNLNDENDEKEMKTGKDHANSNTSVQMNRAARLRLSKKLSNKNIATKSMLI